MTQSIMITELLDAKIILRFKINWSDIYYSKMATVLKSKRAPIEQSRTNEAGA